MVRRHAVSIAIVAVALLLGAYLYFLDSGRVTTTESDARKGNLFRAFRRADITELVIETGGATARISKQTDDAGVMLYYLDQELADQAAVDKTLGVLEFATAERRLDQVDRARMGLDPPVARITLSMGSLTYRLSLGNAAPTPPGAVYAEVRGEKVSEGISVVARDLMTELTRPRDVYRSKTVIPYLSSSLAELGIDGGGDGRRFVQASWGGWAIEVVGQRVRVDRDAFDRLLESFAEIRAEGFPPDAEAEGALAASPERIRMTMIPRDPSLPRAVIDFGGECSGHPEDMVAVRSEPTPKKTACVPKGPMKSLAMPSSSFVDLHLFSLRPDEMEEVVLTAGDKTLDVIRAGAGWHMRSPSDAQIDHEAGQGFAQTLHNLTAETLVAGKSPEGAGFAAPRAVTMITQAGGGEPAAAEKVELGAASGDGFVLVRRLIDGAVLKLSGDASSALLPSSFALRSRKVIDEPLGQLTRVTIASPSVRQVLRRSGAGGWMLEEPKSLVVDAALATDIADALAQLRAERWVADRDDGTFGLEAPRARYQLEREGGMIQVESGRITSGGVFARRTDREGIFVLPAATERVLETWAVDRSYAMVESNEVRRVRIERGADHLVLEAPRAGTPDSGAAAERFEIVRRALSGARAEGTVHLGAPRREEGFNKPLASVRIDRTPPGSAIHWTIGRGDVWRDTNVFYLRRDDIDATFAIAQSKLRPLIDLR